MPSKIACGVAALTITFGTVHLVGSPAADLSARGVQAFRPAVAAASKAGFELSVDSIMRGPKLVGYPPGGLRWSGDSARLYFEWRRPGEDDASTWIVARDGGEPRKLSDAERRTAPPVNGAWDAAHRRVVFADEGDIVLLDSVTGARRQVTRTTDIESNPRWARRETAVTFTRENNLFIVPVDFHAAAPNAPAAPGGIIQLTDVGPRTRDPRETDSQKFIKAEEEKLIEHTRVEAEKKKRAEEKKKEHALPKLELQDRQSAQDLQLSPDGTHVFVVVVERADAAKRAAVPNYVTATGYVEDIPARTMVGDAQDKRLLAVMNLETGKTVWADAGFAGEKREIRWGTTLVSEDGSMAVSSARSNDNKDRWLVTVDPESGKTRVLDVLHDDAWIREVGGFGPIESSFGWMPDQKHLWFLSERDGWMHLYTLDATADHPAARPLTHGKWEIESATLSPDKKRFYLTTNEVHPGERHVYAMPAGGGERTKLTSMTGASSGVVSPDERTFGMVYSYSTKPPELYLMPNTPGAPATQVTTTPTEEWRSFKWADPQLITFRARDGVDVYARLYTPEMMGARRDAAAPGVVFVHGAGYAQNAHKYWASYFREYMFHNLLASKGYVVLDVDYRASSGYGRDWRTAIYRYMGGKDLDDIVDGAKYLVDKQRVNAKHIGVYGGSYGGFITLMALFTSPDTFAAGAALRPVTDWAHYNHGYTSNILNEPQKDPEAYRKSSPIYFAKGLKGALLICHGMVDTNVFFQDTVRLVQRLIELRKENWQVAPYPVENHAFEEETSWADEYKRILKLFEDNLKLKTENSRLKTENPEP
jgi:dipeptidyl aminopeptidase/acylaminoacyl peptidase